MGVNLTEQAMPSRLAAGNHVLLLSGPDYPFATSGRSRSPCST